MIPLIETSDAMSVDLNSWGKAEDIRTDHPMTRLMQETTQFVSRQITRQATHRNALFACKTPFEMMAVQTAFYQQMRDDYMAQSGRVMSLLQDAGRTGRAGIRFGTARAYDDVPI
ncbi:MAG: phasin family protein [Pseudomonadota bacterium]